LQIFCDCSKDHEKLRDFSEYINWDWFF